MMLSLFMDSATVAVGVFVLAAAVLVAFFDVGLLLLPFL